MKYIIRKILKSDWEKYKNIRLEALKNESNAFGSSYEDEFNRTNEEWQKKLEATMQLDGNNFFYATSFNHEFIAIGGAYRDNRREWNLIAIYVRKDHRGWGIGKQLINCILSELKDREVKKVFLAVNTSQTAAIALYKKLGFKIINTLENQLLGDGNHYNEFEMVKDL